MAIDGMDVRVCQCQTRLNRRLLMGRVSKHHQHHPHHPHRHCLCLCHCHQPSNIKHQEGQHQDSHHCHRWQHLRFQSLQLQFQQLICIVADMVYTCLYCTTLAPSDNTASRIVRYCTYQTCNYNGLNLLRNYR